MSNNKSIFKKVMRCVYPLGVCFFTSISSSNAYSACLYSVNSQWNGGFNATIKITNNNSTAVNAWSVNWQYAGQDRIASAYNTNLTGSNPYTAANLGWNGSLQPGQSVEFGLNGNKGSAAAEIPVLTGNICGAISSSSQAKSSVISVSSSSVKVNSSSVVVSSSSMVVSSSSVVVSSSSRMASSSIPSSVISSSKSSSSSVASVAPSSSSKASSSIISSSVHSSSSSTNSSVVSGIGNWNLDSTNSYLSFATTKNVNTVESHTFSGISGSISNSGVATLVVDLGSVDTGNTVRDGRMRGLLFDVINFPNATVTLNLTANQLSDIPVGSSAVQNIAANLNLHGVNAVINTKISVQKLSATRIQVQSLSPIIVNAPDYSLANGVEELRKAVNIESISTAVPVNFVLVYSIQ